MAVAAASVAATQRVTLVLPYPVSANRYWRPVRIGNHITIVPTKEAKAYKKDVELLAIQAGIRKPIVGRVGVLLELYPQRPQDWAKRARKDPDLWDDSVQCMDLGNCEKVVGDALNGIVWTDDKKIWQMDKRRRTPDEHGARLVLTFWPIVVDRIAPELPLCGI